MVLVRVTLCSSQQINVYNETARPIVDAVIEGFNGCCVVLVCEH